MTGKRPIYTLAAVVLILSGFGFGCRSPKTIDHETNALMNTIAKRFQAQKEGASFSVEVSDSYPMGGPVEITAELVNQGEKPIIIALLRGDQRFSQFSLKMVDASGRPAEMTDFGRRFLPRPEEIISRYHLWIKPGDSYQWSLDLVPVYHLSPGIWKLSLSRDFRVVSETGIHRVELRDIPIRVEPERR